MIKQEFKLRDDDEDEEHIAAAKSERQFSYRVN